MEGTYHEKLKIKMDFYVHEVYRVTKNFPKHELYGVTSQLRRASLSVILNYIEGFARNKCYDSKIYKNFLQMSYGSLKESMYLLHFSLTEEYLDRDSYKILIKSGDEIGAMLYKIIK